MDTTVIVDNGKYRFVIANDGKVSCDRCGKPWLVFSEGTKALISLISYAAELEARLKHYERHSSD